MLRSRVGSTACGEGWRHRSVSEAGEAVYSVENDEPQPQVDFAFGFLIVKPPPVIVSMKSTSAFFSYWMLIGSTNSLMPCDSKT